MSGQSFITQLPPEMICCIGDFLGIEKVSLGLTCKSLNNALKRDLKKVKKQVKELKKTLPVTYVINNPHNTILRLQLMLTIKSASTCIRDLSIDERRFFYKHMYNGLKVKPEVTKYESITYESYGNVLNPRVHVVMRDDPQPISYNSKTYKNLIAILMRYINNKKFTVFFDNANRFKKTIKSYEFFADSLVHMLEYLIKQGYTNIKRLDT
jgi:hypothetical protein